MKNIITKAVSLLLLLTMVFNSAGMAQVYAEQILRDELDANAYEFLKAVGALDGNVEYTADKDVSRGLFVKLALNARGIYFDKNDYNDVIFSDVKEDADYANYISTAYRLGYISGVGDSDFNPESPITLIQSIMILSRMLGYSETAERTGGYPYGYTSIARKYDVLKNIEMSDDDTLDMKTAMCLLKNAINADLLEYEILGGDKYKLVNDDGATILTKYLKVYNAVGVITANEYTDLMTENTPVGKNQIAMGNYVFDCGKTDAGDYIGYKAKVYFDGSDDGVKAPAILYIETDKDNTVNTFDISDIEISVDCIEYSTDEERAKRYRVDDYASYILNGKMSAMSLKDIASIGKGAVTLISNDGDRVADVVLVSEYKTYVVSGISYVTNIVSSKNGQSISLIESNDCSVRIIKDGQTADAEAIKEGDTLLVAETDSEGKNLRTVIVGDTVIDGLISASDEDYILVDGVKYKADNILNVSVGKQYRIYIDAMGHAVYAEKENDLVYGFLYFMAKTEIEEDIICKIFTENDRWVELKLAEKIKFNGASKKPDKVYEELGKSADIYRQLIRYSVNADNDIALVDTAEYIPIGSAAEKRGVREDVFRRTYSSSLQYRTASRTFDGRVAVSNETKIFVVPSDYNEENFEILPPAELVQDKKYTFEAYDTDEVLNAGAIVMGSAEKSTSASTNFVIVKSIVSTLDYDGNPAPGIKGYYMGYEVTMPVKLGEKLGESDVKELQKGDVVQVLFDKNGDVSSILKHEPDLNNYYLYNSFYNTFTVVGGVVIKCDSQNNRLRLNYGQDLTGVIALNSPKVYIYELDENRCTVGTVEEIIPNDVIIAKMQHIRCNEIVVIR